MAGAPKVSVFIPVYNRSRYLCVAVNSILAQAFTDFELLLVDDGSTDGSLALLERYAARDPRVRVESNGANLGIPRTRNRGLELARGEYIALLDSDDYAYPGRLESQVRFLDAHRDHVQVGSWGSFMDEQGRLARRVRRQPIAAPDVDAELLFRCCLSNRSIMARTAVLQTYRYGEDFPRCQDYDMHVRLAERHSMANLATILVCGRQHAGRYTGLTQDLGRERKMAINRAQLEALGLSPSEADLEQHYLLSRGGLAEREYLQWAEAWLGDLLAANRQVGRYRQASLTRAVGKRWFVLCKQAGRAMGPWAAARMLASPLLRMAAPYVDWRTLRPALTPSLALDPSAPAS
ncbi:MAG: glycosyltransferase [Betaproteobacteria bacterium]|nr:glycosyltransferase [Betaproteobacteria bacterium]